MGQTNRAQLAWLQELDQRGKLGSVAECSIRDPQKGLVMVSAQEAIETLMEMSDDELDVALSGEENPTEDPSDAPPSSEPSDKPSEPPPSPSSESDSTDTPSPATPPSDPSSSSGERTD
jgi:hypothetical protein